MTKPHTRRAEGRSTKTYALRRFLSGDVRALQALTAPDYPRDPATGELDYKRMTTEEIKQRIREIYDHMTEEERAAHYPDGFRLPTPSDLTDEELKQRISALRNTSHP